MKIVQLLETQEPLEQSVEEQIELIRRECGDILPAYRTTRTVLLRGEKIRCRSFESNIRSDRQPLYMLKWKHDLLTRAFDELDFPVNRSNGLFCSCAGEIVETWGESYIIFPKNGWKGLAFKMVHEGYVFDSLERIMQSIRDPEYELEYLVEKIKKLQPIILDYTNITPILRNQYEDILIGGRGYIAVRNLTNSLSDAPEILRGLNLQPANLGDMWRGKF